ncbi:MAG: DUF1559 domain-containing protein [Planctomycetaceae bacterium]|nr:DUF1559 domain-containing protein [Planctomycetaceae bacterium]
MNRGALLIGLFIAAFLSNGCNPVVDSPESDAASAGTLTAFVETTTTEVAQDADGAEDRLVDEPIESPRDYDHAVEITKQTPGYRNLQKIGLAFHGYHDIFGKFPPAVLTGPDGKTPYSWRVELLPILKHYVDEIDSEQLRGKTDREGYWKLIENCGYDLSQPWDSPANQAFLEKGNNVFRHPTDNAVSTASGFYAIVGEGTAFDPNERSRYDDIKGWPASTLLIVEARCREPWTRPIDIAYSDISTVPLLGGFSRHGFLALSADGAVHFVSNVEPPDDIRAFISKSKSDSFEIPGIPYRYQ